jgi:hypothetical protein
VRKRIVTGLLVIGVAAFFVSQPRKATVAWHKRGYLAPSTAFMGRFFDAQPPNLLAASMNDASAG